MREGGAEEEIVVFGEVFDAEFEFGEGVNANGQTGVNISQMNSIFSNRMFIRDGGEVALELGPNEHIFVIIINVACDFEVAAALVSGADKFDDVFVDALKEVVVTCLELGAKRDFLK